MTPRAPATFPALADSPLLTRSLSGGEYADLAVHLAATAAPDSATVRALLSITSQSVSGRIARALQERTDLPPAILAILVAAHPDLNEATARLTDHLFPAGTRCHRFTRAMAALACQPETLDPGFTATDRFASAAAAADPSTLLGPVLSPKSQIAACIDPPPVARRNACLAHQQGSASKSRLARHGGRAGDPSRDLRDQPRHQAA
jgi:hypothetical protein